MHAVRTLFLGLLVLTAAPAARAATVFSTFGLADTYFAGIGWTISLDGLFDGTSFSQGDQFTPAGEYTLDRVELAAGLVAGPNELDVRLHADDGGAPGSLLEAWHFSDALGPFGNANPVLGADSSLHPVLLPGTPYWLIAAGSHSGTHAAWNFNSVGASGPHALQSGGGAWSSSSDPFGAFRIHGTPADPGDPGHGPIIPEPSTWLLLGLGAAALSLYRRRSR